ncbi:MAG TPA: hypothetical protein VK892_00700 [Pyrinomonadaceae bacterium]|nr:hypothetical protein [Pyrinomonadaceae bacterium]
MILVILAIYFGYKKAKQAGRNPFLWAFITAAAFIGTQWLTAIAIYILFAIGVAAFGWSENVFVDYEVLINIISIVASIISLLLVFRYLDKIPVEEPITEPPLPPTFYNEGKN